VGLVAECCGAGGGAVMSYFGAGGVILSYIGAVGVILWGWWRNVAGLRSTAYSVAVTSAYFEASTYYEGFDTP